MTKVNRFKGGKKYLEFLYEAFHEHSLFTGMNNLHQRAIYPLTSHLAEEYEDIEQLNENLIEEVEK